MSRRRPRQNEHENHERWLVSYADFITLLFAFFVVMYAISSVNEGKYRVLSDSMVQAFRSANVNGQGEAIIMPPVIVPAAQPAPPAPVPTEAKENIIDEKRRVLSKRMRSMADEIKEALQPLTRDGQVQVTEGAHGITVEINASVVFPVGQAAIGGNAARALEAVATVLVDADFPITIEGHTDNTPINTPQFPSNWELSAVRASSVVRLFVEAGVDPSRLTAAGYGDQRPLADNAFEDGRARNRRVTLLIESLLDEEPVTPPLRPSTVVESIESALPLEPAPGAEVPAATPPASR